jgi:hypothetical protein
MKLKVMIDGSAYSRIRSQDERDHLIFDVCANHEKNCDSLRKQPMLKVMKEFKDLENPMECCHVLL